MSRVDTAALGLWGESCAADYLTRRGFQILARRWRCPYGELDLIAADESYLVFVEVKLRKSAAFAPARAFVTARKQQHLRDAAALYLTEHPTELQPRFDVVEIYAPAGTATRRPDIFLWENAF